MYYNIWQKYFVDNTKICSNGNGIKSLEALLQQSWLVSLVFVIRQTEVLIGQRGG